MKDRKYPVRRSIRVACGRDSGSPSAKSGNRRHTRSRAIFDVLAICLAATSLHAQSARELETTCREVEETERQKPSLTTRVERLVKAVMADTSSKSGFYPQLDSVYAVEGFTPGVGYRGRSGD